MSVESVVIVSVVVLAFSIALAFLAKALGRASETLQQVVMDQNRIVGDAIGDFAKLATDASDKAHALGDEYREMYHAKVEASKSNDNDGLVKLSDDEKAIIAHYRNNRQMEAAIANPPPNPADDLINLPQ
jgi:hypothetical protein